MAVFVAVVESGSLAAAARKTQLTPSAVSKLVARLEASLGVRLLQRTTRTMTVTSAGRTFFERARSLLSELRSLEQEVRGESAAHRGRVRVSAPQLLGQTLVVPILLAFQERFPGVSLDLELTDRVVDLVGEGTDVAVRITTTPPAAFVARRVGAVRRILCASPDYLRSRRPPRTVEDLQSHQCLLLAGPSSPPYWQFVTDEKLGAHQTVKVAARLRTTSTLALYEAAKAGLGIAELPHYLVEDDLRAHRLTRVLEQLEPTEPVVYVVYAATGLLPRRVHELAKHLATALAAALSRLPVHAPRAARPPKASRVVR